MNILNRTLKKYIQKYYCYIGGTKNEIKWKTLSHNGIIFPEPYIQHKIPLIYNGKKIILNSEAEEYATYYVNPRYDNYRNDKFKKNFWGDFKKIIDKNLEIVDFNLCDFSMIKKYVLEMKEKNANISKEEKLKKKTLSLELTEKYKYATVDGVKEAIDNYTIEIPGIFMGRGNHPYIGKIKKRIIPEDVTINIGKEEKIPNINIPGHKWGKIIHDNKLEWIASWKNNVTNKTNYARFGRMSKFKMNSDLGKFELARNLKNKINNIRKTNAEVLIHEKKKYRQLATALYLIDKLALRVGNEKGKDKADTVGVSTLKVKNVKLLGNNTIKLDFLSKDSVRYYNTYQVDDDNVYKNLEEFTTNKNDNDQLFDLISSGDINNYIVSYIKNVTSRTFRTMNASYLFQKKLNEITKKYKNEKNNEKNKDKILHDISLAYVDVAKLCNHVKTISNDGINKKMKKIKTTLEKYMEKKKQYEEQKQKYTMENKDTKKINKMINNIKKKIEKIKMNKIIATKTQSLSVGTSKINYLDPRILFGFLKKNNMMDVIFKFLTKKQVEQFKWAESIDESFEF